MNGSIDFAKLRLDERLDDWSPWMPSALLAKLSRKGKETGDGTSADKNSEATDRDLDKEFAAAFEDAKNHLELVWEDAQILPVRELFLS